MQIDGSGSISSHIQTTKEGGQAQQNTSVNELNKNLQNGSNASNNVSQTDSVTLTSTASRLQEVEQQISNQPVVDAQRVEDIKQVIRNDGLESSPERTADKIISFESALNGARTEA